MDTVREAETVAQRDELLRHAVARVGTDERDVCTRQPRGGVDEQFEALAVRDPPDVEDERRLVADADELAEPAALAAGKSIREPVRPYGDALLRNARVSVLAGLDPRCGDDSTRPAEDASEDSRVERALQRHLAVLRRHHAETLEHVRHAARCTP